VIVELTTVCKNIPATSAADGLQMKTTSP